MKLGTRFQQKVIILKKPTGNQLHMWKSLYLTFVLNGHGKSVYFHCHWEILLKGETTLNERELCK